MSAACRIILGTTLVPLAGRLLYLEQCSSGKILQAISGNKRLRSACQAYFPDAIGTKTPYKEDTK